MQRLFLIILALVLCSGSGNAGGSAVFSHSSDPKEALEFIGAPNTGHHIQGTIVTRGEYHGFSKKLVAIWVKKDAAGLKRLLTQSTVDLYASTGEAKVLDQWAAGMGEHLLKCNRETPKIFITLIDDLPDNKIYLSQKKWFIYPETPPVALLLYSYDAKKQQLTGRMLYPVKKNGKIRLLLEKPKA